MTSKAPRVAYEPHPVTPQRKKELRAQGFKIIDAVFAPVGRIEPVAAVNDGKVPEDRERITLMGELRDRSITFDESMPTDELRALTITPQGDGLDELEADELHVLAKERGVKVHANAGADKVREALRKASQDGAGA